MVYLQNLFDEILKLPFPPSAYLNAHISFLFIILSAILSFIMFSKEDATVCNIMKRNMLELHAICLVILSWKKWNYFFSKLKPCKQSIFKTFVSNFLPFVYSNTIILIWISFEKLSFLFVGSLFLICYLN